MTAYYKKYVQNKKAYTSIIGGTIIHQIIQKYFSNYKSMDDGEGILKIVIECTDAKKNTIFKIHEKESYICRKFKQM
jgi:hypothetical protein